PDLHAWRLHVDQQKADPFMLAGVVGTHEAEAPIGELRARGPDLLAVDEEMIALVHALRAQACEIGSSARLGVALAPPDLASHDARDVPFLLLFIAVFEERGPEHHHAHAADRTEGAEAVHLLLKDARLLLREAAAAIQHGPGGRSPPFVGHRLLPARKIGGK